MLIIMTLVGQSSCLLHAQSPSKVVIIRDIYTQDPIPQAIVSIGKTRYSSDDKGKVLLDFSRGNEIEITHVSYESRKIKSIELKGQSTPKQIFIDLYPKSETLSEVIVTSKKNRKVLAISENLSTEEISSNLGNSLAEAISKIKGVSILSTGPNASKPVIHGMHSNRVMIVNNGIRHVGQNWGIEQTPELDFSMAGNVRVIKGAEVVKHGSGALGGVVEVDVPQLHYREAPIGGNLSTSYATNGRSVLGKVSLHGSISNHWAWELQTALQNTGDKHTADYLLNNTGSRVISGTAHIGYQSKRLFSDLLFSYFDNKDGGMLAWQIGSESLFQERLKIGRPSLIYPFTRDITYPYSHIKHFLATLKSSYMLTPSQKLMLNLSHQVNIHKDYQNRRNYRSYVPEFSMLLKTSDALLTWDNYNLWGSRIELGAELQFSRNDNPEDTGVTPMIPNYVEFVTSLFGWQKKQWNKVTMDWGIRWENYFNSAAGYDFAGDYYDGVIKHNLLGGQMGISYKLSDLFSIVSDISILQRSPHVYERYSLGVDKASGVFSKGKHDLKPETGYKWVLSIEGNTDKLRWSVEGFLQYVDGYIYQATNRKRFTTQAGTFPIFDYRQENSLFRGIDAKFGWDILGKKLYYGAQCGVTVGVTKSKLYVPNVSPLRFRQWIQSEQHLNVGDGLTLSADLEHIYCAKQHNFSPEMDLVDFTPPAYHLVNMSLCGTYQLPKKQTLALQVTAENLLNKLYKDYTNRFRYYFHDLGRNVKLRLTWSF